MKKTSIYFAFIFLLYFSKAQTNILFNPATVYCKSMGYSWIISPDSMGNEKGLCLLPDNSYVDEWEFYRGKVKQNYSYCAKLGYPIVCKMENIEGYTSEYAVCQATRNHPIRIFENGQWVNKDEIPMIDLMEINGDYFLFSDTISIDGTLPYDENNEDIIPSYSNSIPTSFDLRNHDGHSYIGSIQNQGSCGSCYAFGTAATAEGTYNYTTESWNEKRKAFSESFVAWCLGGLAEYNPHFYGCRGSDNTRQEIASLTSYGIIERYHFPYQTTPPSECNYWNDSRAHFSNWSRIPCGDITSAKNAILNYGVIYATVYATTEFKNYTGDVFCNSDTTCMATPCYNYSNHAVALIGWGHDSQKGDYWILRNSWGPGWGENGYMRISTKAARVACGLTYLIPNPVTYINDYILENVHIKPDRNVVFQGGNIIVLQDGFVAENGSNFLAYISPSQNGYRNLAVEESNHNHTVNQKPSNDFEDNIALYPNPTSGQIFIKCDNMVIEKIEVRNAIGDIVDTIDHPNDSLINLNSSCNGLYFLYIYSHDKVVVKKILKQ